jgi:hypothetical protein
LKTYHDVDIALGSLVLNNLSLYFVKYSPYLSMLQLTVVGGGGGGGGDDGLLQFRILIYEIYESI